ncbi:hypothetical protein C0995_012229 [Termitomyces sp. Mi166|nr:hypothetical protein C0995_012229 [Termitomyces sp. Mi166\
MAMYLDEFTIWETFLDGIPAEMHRALICDNNLSPEVNTVTEILGSDVDCQQALTGDAPVAKESRYMPRAGQPGPKGAQDGPPKVSHPKDCKVLKAQVQAAHTAAKNSDVESNAEENQEELVNNKEVPPEVEEPEGDDDAESVHIDGDEYVTVDIYDNEYYAHDNKEEHLFALTEHQGDKRICMRRVTLQKADDKLQRPQYTP